MLRGLRRRLALIFTAFTGLVLAGVLGVLLALGIQQRIRDNEQWFQQTIDNLYLHMLNLGVPNSGGAKGGVVVEQYPYIIAINLNGSPLAEASTITVRKSWTPDSDRQVLFKAAQDAAEERGLANWFSQDIVMATSTEVFEHYADAALAEDAADLEANSAPPPWSATASQPWVVIPILSETISSNNGVFEQTVDGVDYRATYFEVPRSDHWVFSAEGENGNVNQAYSDDSKLYQVALLEDLRPQKQGIVLLCLGYGGLFLAGLAGLFLANWLLAKLVLHTTAEGMQRQADFVAAASHELRSPLAVVRSSLSAAKVAVTAAEAERYNKAAETEAVRMGRLVDDLLLLAGGDTKSWDIERCEVDLDTILIGSSEQYAPQAQKRQLALELRLPEETLPRVKGDAARLRQILGVLLDNALQYAPACSGIELSAGTKKNKVWVQLADHGPGIPDEEKSKVFARFYRADQSRGDKDHFGLGLSVARELANLHGGSLAVADTPGGGASFTLTLPVASAAEDKKTHKNSR